MLKKMNCIILVCSLLFCLSNNRIVAYKNNDCVECEYTTVKNANNSGIREHPEPGDYYSDLFEYNGVIYAVFNKNDIENIYFVDIANVTADLYREETTIQRAPCLPGDPGYPGCAVPSTPSTTGIPNRIIINWDGWINCMLTALLGEFGVIASQITVEYFFKANSFQVAFASVAAKYSIASSALVLAINGLICYQINTKKA